MESIVFRFENCELISVPKKYIKGYMISKDSSGKLIDIEIAFKRGMRYTERWAIGFPELDKELNANPPKRDLFRRMSCGDVCNIGIKESATEGEWFDVPIEPNTDLFLNRNPWQIFDKETKTLTIKNPNL